MIDHHNRNGRYPQLSRRVERKKASNDRIGPIIARFTESMLSVHPDQ